MAHARRAGAESNDPFHEESRDGGRPLVCCRARQRPVWLGRRARWFWWRVVGLSGSVCGLAGVARAAMLRSAGLACRCALQRRVDLIVGYHGGAAVRRVRLIPHDLLLFFSDLAAAWCAVGPRETAAADGGDASVIITGGGRGAGGGGRGGGAGGGGGGAGGRGGRRGREGGRGRS